MSIFPDGVDLATAETLAGELTTPRAIRPRGLARLVDASMIEADFGEGTRYRMLETLRAFGLDRLEAAGETDAAAERLLRWAVELTAWVEQTARAPQTSRRPMRSCAANCPTSARRGGWPGVVARSTRRRPSSRH